VGKILPMGDFPASVAVSPNGRYAAVLHCGWGQHQVRVLDMESQAEVSSAPLRNAWVGAAWNPQGDSLLVSGGTDDVLVRFPFKDGKLGTPVTLTVPIENDPFHDPVGELAASLRADHTTASQTERPRYPGGMAIGQAGKFAYVAEMYAGRLTRVQLPKAGETGRVRADARILARFEAHAYPYRVLLNPRQPIAYVSLWGGSGVAAVNVRTGATERISTDPHPNEMAISPDGTRLFVACANSNHVDVIDTSFHKVIERLDTALYPNAPAGSTPNGLALSRDGKLLLVANADNNNIAVFDVSDRDGATPLGYVPTGWYPTCVAFTSSGGILAISGKGNGSLANPNGPIPGIHEPGRQYIGGLLLGTAAFIDWPDHDKMHEYTDLSYRASPLRGDFGPVGAPDDANTSNAIPAKLGDPSPIRYIVYIVKENRTYDQVLGDIPEGNGDPSLCLFGEQVTPNQHALARQFVLLDNFYCDAEVSADGHEWSMGAYATDYVERTWPIAYGRHGAVGFPAEGKDPNGFPPAGHLWDRAKEAGIEYRSYGEFVEGGVGSSARPSAPALVGHIDPRFPEFDMTIPDEARAAEFIRELREFEKNGNMPQLSIIRLPCDHTVGTRPGWRTPRAYVAEHDQGFASILEALSHSRYWPEMAVFAIEDDAQNGSDHVDAHRTIAYVASPYARRGHVDHTLYSTTSMLRTIELILGLQPMSQFDAAARPMYNSFTGTADLSGFDKRPAQVDLQERNGRNAPMARIAQKMNFSREDANPDVLFNEIIWKSVKGADSVMPAPIRAAFIRPLPEADHEDED
jgi:YVTN family beta-propeller protein